MTSKVNVVPLIQRCHHLSSFLLVVVVVITIVCGAGATTSFSANWDGTNTSDRRRPHHSRTKPRTNVTIAVFVPLYTETGNRAVEEAGQGILPAIQLARDHINAYSDLLPDHYLNFVINDTKCDAAVGMKSLFDMIFNKPKKVILFGDLCTTVTDPIAKTARVLNLTQLSYADTHPMFVGDKYPNLFRVVPSEMEFNPARLKLLQHFKWKRVGILWQTELRFALSNNKLLKYLDNEGIDIAESVGLVDELTNQIDKLKESDVRIILGTFDESWAKRIFCKAYEIGMFGRKYQWIITGMYSNEWWKVEDSRVTCNSQQMLKVLQGYIATDVLPLETSGNITISNLTAKQYEEMYEAKSNKKYSRFHGYAYDGIWTIALTIKLVQEKLKEGNWSYADLELNDFEYRSPFWGEIFSQALREISFDGVTGPVSFVDNQRQGYIRLKQFQNESEVKIGEFNSIENTLYLDHSQIEWDERGPPIDKTVVEIEPSRVSINIYSALATLASCGILLAIVFLVINTYHRKERYIKMSSPYLNNLIIIGCILTYTSVILLGLDSSLTNVNNFVYICTARSWVLMSGFTLAFGSMFSKTWRVHTIFTDIKLNKKVIKDYQLFLIVGVLLMVDIVILISWQIIDPFYRETTQLQPIVSSDNDVQVIPQIESCRSHNMTIFLGTIYAYKGLLMFFGCLLAWETRHVSIPALNDSKYIGMSVYNVVIMCCTGAAISFVLKDQQDASFIIISIFIIFCTTGTLCLVFVPKLIELKRNRGGGSDRRIRATLKAGKKTHRSCEDAGLSKKIRDLQQEVNKHKRVLEQRDTDIRKYLDQLSCDKRSVVDRRKTLPTLAEDSCGTVEVPILHITRNASMDEESEEFLGSSEPSKNSFTYTTAITQSPTQSETGNGSIMKKEYIPMLRISSPPSNRKVDRTGDESRRIKINVDGDSAGEEMEDEVENDEESFAYHVQKIGNNSEDDDSDSSFELIAGYRHVNTPTSLYYQSSDKGAKYHSQNDHGSLVSSSTCNNYHEQLQRTADSESMLKDKSPTVSNSSLPLCAAKLVSQNDAVMGTSMNECSRTENLDKNSMRDPRRFSCYDSDTGSYARAIKDSYQLGTVSDTAEESSATECGNYTSSHSEAMESPLESCEYRKRAKSVGALRSADVDEDVYTRKRFAYRLNDVERRNSCDPRTVSFIDTFNKKVPRSNILPPIFPYFNELVRLSDPSNINDNGGSLSSRGRHPHQQFDSRQHQINSNSYPSIKCDIVEYL